MITVTVRHQASWLEQGYNAARMGLPLDSCVNRWQRWGWLIGKAGL